jgi:hypothetical protein
MTFKMAAHGLLFFSAAGHSPPSFRLYEPSQKKRETSKVTMAIQQQQQLVYCCLKYYYARLDIIISSRISLSY